MDSLAHDAELQAVFTFVSDAGPTLLAFNADGTKQLQEGGENSIAQLGSAPSDLRERFRLTISNLLRMPELSPDRLLVCCLSWVQGYGLRQALMENGVGGAFAGLLCTDEGIAWHPDLLFVLCDVASTFVNTTVPASIGSVFRFRGTVSSFVRDDVHIVRSTFTNSANAIATPPSARRLRRSLPSQQSIVEALDNVRYEFVAVVDTQSEKVVVVHMDKQNDHRYLYVRKNGMYVTLRGPIIAEFGNPEIPAGLGMMIFYSYEPPGPGDSPPDIRPGAS